MRLRTERLGTVAGSSCKIKELADSKGPFPPFIGKNPLVRGTKNKPDAISRPEVI